MKILYMCADSGVYDAYACNDVIVQVIQVSENRTYMQMINFIDSVRLSLFGIVMREISYQRGI